MAITSTFNFIIKIFLTAFLSVACSMCVEAQQADKKVPDTKMHIFYFEKPQIDINEVKDYMDSIGIINSEIVCRQAILETGHFRHKACMDKNNLFGFRFTKKYMRFDTWQASVEYYKKWQARKYTDTTENYYRFLSRIRFASAWNYIPVLKRIRLNLNPDLTND